jgi:hypothetical protein
MPVIVNHGCASPANSLAPGLSNGPLVNCDKSVAVEVAARSQEPEASS